MTRAQCSAVLWAVLPTAALLSANGLYLGAAHRASPSLFWLLDALQFFVVPLASVWALWRVAGVGPRAYGLGPLGDPGSGLRSLAMYALVVSVFVSGYGLARLATLYLPWGWPASAFVYSEALPRHPPAALAVLGYLSLSGALVEEVMYRGLPALCLPRGLYPLVSAGAFSLIHWESGTREVLATFLLGLALAALYARLRNLWPFVAGHAVTDMLGFTGYYAY